MKPRIEKKLSKKLARILCKVRGFTDKDVWIDSDFEIWPRHYASRYGKPLTSKQKRQNYERRVSVNCMPSIGGGVDYWGEGEDWHSVLYVAQDFLVWEMFEIEPFNEETCKGGYPVVNKKLTGKNVIALAKDCAEKYQPV